MLQPTKAELRTVASARRNALAGRTERSAAICDRLMELDVFRHARAIHSYLPMRSEVSTLTLVRAALAAGKGVMVPLMEPGEQTPRHGWISAADLEQPGRGALGTPLPAQAAPADPAICDLIVVPLLAFDRSCFRIGYGKGHYDRLLTGLHASAVGVAFAAQELPTIPADPWDVPLSAIITENEVIANSRAIL
jgi:5-formyltetrahydrofolate cyclo-ligase